MTTNHKSIPKAATGISGLDQILNGGLPQGRTTLITGNSGTGKTLLGIEFLVNGIREYSENAILVTFEESAPKVTENVSSLGFDLDKLQDDGKLAMMAFKVDPPEKSMGYFDFTPFLVLLEDAIERTGAKRVVLDTIELLFGAYSDETTMRIELVKLMRWLEVHDVTGIITGEKGKNSLTRFGIEEYASDCVIVLDHRVHADVSTRLLRVLKYRGSAHGTNEYPFLIGQDGFVVLPVTSLSLDYAVSWERVPIGVPELDEMLSGGLYRGSTTLISGVAGTGKTSIAMSMVNAACARGERSLVLLHEESTPQLERNMNSIGINLKQWTDSGMLKIWASLPQEFGLENHLAVFTNMLDSFKPVIVAIDGLMAFSKGDLDPDVFIFTTRKIGILKSRGITTVITTLGKGVEDESSHLHISSMIDTGILLRNVEKSGERNRLLVVTKSRGTKHSNRLREFILSSDGIHLVDVYVGPNGILVGSERRVQEIIDESRHQGRIGQCQLNGSEDGVNFFAPLRSCH
jgi:circadian clock protein KaiC